MEIEKQSYYSQNININEEASKLNHNSEILKVQVALRVRPFITKEIIDNEPKCVTCFPESNQILMGKDRQFTFDKVFDDDAKQQSVYEYCAKGLVLSCLNGYNATVLAYGQTGSGKTYTMGSTTACENTGQNVGIIPRVIKDLFLEIEAKKFNTEFLVKVSFLEIYNEEINDLLDPIVTNTRFKFNQNNTAKNPISIREEKDGSISVYGVTEEKVSSYEEIAACLERGSVHRSTASTLMNETSSRSHAIFTISIDQNQTTEQKDHVESNFITAKFHFVDLAGSERAKKTGATGAVLREGININRGLLALGNVISALTDDTAKIFHIPYRESKLTRILQDSLGGNSHTIMIACISPAESNFEESLNTLKYASRARNIRNKPVVNRDPQSALITQLKQQLYELQNELIGYKRILISQNLLNSTMSIGSNMITNSINTSGNTNNALNNENGLLKTNLSSTQSGLKNFNNMNDTIEELKNCKIKLVQYEKQINNLLNELQNVKKALNESEINFYSVQKERDLLKILNDKYKARLDEHRIAIAVDNNLIELQSKNMVEEYLQKIEKLKQEVNDQNIMNKELQEEYANLLKNSNQEHELLLAKTKLVHILQRKLRDIEKAQKYENNALFETPNSKDNTQMAASKTQIIPQNNALRNKPYEIENEISDCESKGNDGNYDDYEGNNYAIKSEEDELIEREFETASELHKKEMFLVDGTLNEKEELLRNITQSQMILEKNLVADMKQEYHHKIHQLENELKILEKQRDEAINKINLIGHNERDKIIQTYKQKITELESKMKEFKKKEKEQNSLMKLVQTQQQKLKELDEEIKRMKAQKIQLAKKMREDNEKYEQWKSSRQRELQQIKKKNMEKDAEIQKLKNENKRKDMLFKKKTEELLSKHMSQDLLKQIQVTPSRISNTNIMNAPNRDKTKISKPIETKNPSSMNANNIEYEIIPEDRIRELVDLCSQKLIENLELNYIIQKEEENLRKSENELDIEQKKYAEILLKKDKLELDKQNMTMDIETEQDYKVQWQGYKLELDDVYSRIETLEEKIKYQQLKIYQLTQDLSLKPEFNAEQMLINNTNPANTITVLRILLAKYIAANFDVLKLQEKIKQNTLDMQEIKKKYEESEQKRRLAELQFDINLTKLKKEYEIRQMVLIKSYEEDNDNLQGQGSSTQTNSIESEREVNQEGNLEERPGTQNEITSSSNLIGPSLTLAQARQKKLNSNFELPTIANKLKSQHSDESTMMTSNTNSIKQRATNEALAEANKKLEKIISDMRWKQKESDRQIETLKRKCEILQLKCDQLKKQTAKEKFIGISKTQDDISNSLQSTAATNSNAPITAIQQHHQQQQQQLSNNNSQVTTVGASPLNITVPNSQVVNGQVIQPQNNPQIKQISSQKSLTNMGNGVNSQPVIQSKIQMVSLKDRRKEEKEQKATNNDEPRSARRSTGSIPAINSKVSIAPLSQAGQTNINQIQAKHQKTNNLMPNLLKRNSSPSRLGKEYTEPSPRFFMPFLNPNPSADTGEGPSELRGIPLGDAEVTEGFDKQMLFFDEAMLNENSNMNYNNNIWKCNGSWEAHNGQVYCVTSQDNFLYSSSNKTVKMWSLDNLSLINEINAHSGFIKAMAIWPKRNILATACDKTINLWDLISLQSICSLRAKDEIRTMHVYNELLFSAGKGSPTNGAILAWDLRSLKLVNIPQFSIKNPFFMIPVEEKEKNQDIFSLISHEDILYYGCRNHQVRRVNLLNMESLAPFEPPHFDVVTSLAIVKDYLVSGSRDKNLRLWNLDTRIQNLKSTSYAHQGWVNVIETNNSKSLLYSGSKDGSIKVWVVHGSKLRCLSDINAHLQSVNSICKLSNDQENMFCTASNDKTIKIWKPTNDDNIFMNKNYEDMMDENP